MLRSTRTRNALIGEGPQAERSFNIWNTNRSSVYNVSPYTFATYTSPCEKDRRLSS